MRKLKRDIIISVVDGKDLVGVYYEDTDGSETLLECSPEKADAIIKVWNKEELRGSENMRNCDNVDHPKEAGKGSKVHKIKLRVDFNYDICYWCDVCIQRDNDFVLKVIK